MASTEKRFSLLALSESVTRYFNQRNFEKPRCQPPFYELLDSFDEELY
jgi:hypothetical protein